ncbi:thioesterase family protein [Acinetobacter sp. ANC 4641]|uniref:thioesterase family protein n=1 Tax=Acinetobacter sp. ANC 4641 TaxID=2529847 RepID=UPI00103F0918|nr:thioesterase family protein [Acinetobacter sp. ANC 4641]TCB08291.1 thioesterase family protein [Acinetobacter sp. ANC 4641]
MTAYYQLLQRHQDTEKQVTTAYYCSTIHAQGAWNSHEQHMAPATGILCAELEQFFPRENMRIGRISLDIFGLIAAGEFVIQTQVIRAGKTIELIEAQMQAQGKTCIVARAWRMQTIDTHAIAGLEDDSISLPEHSLPEERLKLWPGGFIESVEVRTHASLTRAGKGIVWLNTHIDMVQDQPTSDFVHLMGLVDTANGIVPRQKEQFTWSFANLDLQIHLHRLPHGRWLGLETVQQYGEDGIGLTSSILHDEQGPFGRSEQILTLRPMA